MIKRIEDQEGVIAQRQCAHCDRTSAAGADARQIELGVVDQFLHRPRVLQHYESLLVEVGKREISAARFVGG